MVPFEILVSCPCENLWLSWLNLMAQMTPWTLYICEKKGRFYVGITLEEIVSQVGSALQLPIDLFYSHTRNRQATWGRPVCAYSSNKLGGYPLREIAGHLSRDPVAICQGLKKVEQSLRGDKNFEGAMTALENNLSKNKRWKIKT